LARPAQNSSVNAGVICVAVLLRPKRLLISVFCHPLDLSKDLEPVLEQLRKYRKKQWLEKGKKVQDWVFCNEEGNHLNEFLFRMRKFYPLLRVAKLRSFRIHDLRHTYASLLLQNGESVTGESVTYVKEQMGHHSIQITVDTLAT
jgi:integrase